MFICWAWLYCMSVKGSSTEDLYYEAVIWMCITCSSKVHPSSEWELENLHNQNHYFFFFEQQLGGTGTYSVYFPVPLLCRKSCVIWHLFAVYFLVFCEAIRQVMPKPFFSYTAHSNRMRHCLLNPSAAAVRMGCPGVTSVRVSTCLGYALQWWTWSCRESSGLGVWGTRGSVFGCIPL